MIKFKITLFKFLMKKIKLQSIQNVIFDFSLFNFIMMMIRIFYSKTIFEFLYSLPIYHKTKVEACGKNNKH